MNKIEVVIVEALRSPIGKFMGQLSSLSAPQIAAHVIRELIKKTCINSKDLDEVIIGNVLQAGVGQNPARQASIFGGISNNTGAYTVNKVCGSGLKAIMLGAQAIKAKEAEIVIAGGMESMTNAPHLLFKSREIKKYGNITKSELQKYNADFNLVDSMINDGLWCAFNKCHMGNLAEKLIKKYKIAREDQDKFALSSHKKAVKATNNLDFKREIVSVKVNNKKIKVDEGPRRDTNLKKLAALNPIFKKEGTITPGNSSSLNDAASVVLIMPYNKAKELGLKPLVVIEGYSSSSTDPKWFTTAPVNSVKYLLNKTRHKIDDFDLIEENEAYAAQSIAVMKELNIEEKRLNVNGGAIALGHPIGASGARILTTLIHSLNKRKKDLGLATLCIGGGESVSMSIKRI